MPDADAGRSARDTIAAIATPAGRGGIGIVRISGPGAPEIARTLTGALYNLPINHFEILIF